MSFKSLYIQPLLWWSLVLHEFLFVRGCITSACSGSPTAILHNCTVACEANSPTTEEVKSTDRMCSDQLPPASFEETVQVKFKELSAGESLPKMTNTLKLSALPHTTKSNQPVRKKGKWSTNREEEEIRQV